MDAELLGKTALVTGGGSGIGRATALILARERAVVYIADRDEVSAEATAKVIRARGGAATGFAVDVTDEGAIMKMMDAIRDRHGSLDIALNNAGIGSAGAGCAGMRTEEIGRPAWDRLLAVNLTGLWTCMKHELLVMANHGGAIVNNASIAALAGVQGAAGYTASKHAVLGLTRSAAIENASRGIRINAICPGQINTPLMAHVLDSNAAVVTSAIPMGRLGAPEEVGEMVAWLLSSRASFCTGGAFGIDGGQSAV